MYDEIFESFRCCITQQKCKKCPRAKNGCNANSTMGNGIQIPKLLALDVLNKLKELQNEVDELSFQLYG